MTGPFVKPAVSDARRTRPEDQPIADGEDHLGDGHTVADHLLLRVSEAAERLSISRSTLYLLLAQGQVRSINIGRAVRIPACELERFVRRALQTDAYDEGRQ